MKRKLSIFVVLVIAFSSITINAFATKNSENDYQTNENSDILLSDVDPENDIDTELSLPPADISHVKPDNNTIYPDGVTFYSIAEGEQDIVSAASNGTVSPASEYANYNGSTAAAYALQYAESPNSYYKELDSDCTNFVSQAIAVGGVVSYIGNFSSKPILTKNWIVDSNSNAWYMIKKTRTVGVDYWVYSKTWANVNDFRNFHTARSASGSNTFYGYLSGSTPNRTLNENTNFEYKLRKYAQVGQVWQLTSHHSIIITKVTQRSDGYNYVWYSGHTNTAKNENIQRFLDFCYENPSCQIARMSFS